MQIIKLKRIGSNILEEVNLQRFYLALERANSIDDLIRIGDISYVLSSLIIEAPGNLVAAVSVSTNEALHLFSAPKLMIPAPGIGKFIRVIDVYGKNFVGTIPFSGLPPKLRYVGIGGNDISQFDVNFLTATQTVVRSGNLSITNSKTYPENVGVEFLVPGFDPTAGNGSMLIVITYSIQDY